MLRPQAVADIRITDLEDSVLLDEILVYLAGGNDVVCDVIKDCKVSLRRERQLDVGQLIGCLLYTSDAADE